MTQTTYACPKCGQASVESDFCSECGARIEVEVSATPASAPPIATPMDPGASALAGLEECPACNTPRPAPDARFCEVCRYDFVKQSAGGPPVVAPAASTTPVAHLTEAVTVSNHEKWDVVIAVDPSLDTEPDPDMSVPQDPERRIPLDKAENLIGRRDVDQSSVPDVRPHDPSVSRRHAKLLLRADGTVAILDLESANGTFVNGEQILAGVPRYLAQGDVVTLGRWTRLRVEPRGNL